MGGPSPRPLAAISWSGGKDSYTALARTISRFDVRAAITMIDEAGERSRSHGLRPEVIAAQSASLGLRPVTVRCSWGSYTDAFVTAARQLAATGITHVIFGDIMFDDHRAWADDVCRGAGLSAVEPIWGGSTPDLLREFVESGARAIIVTVRADLLDDTWLGRPLTLELGAELAGRGLDPCGERGEYHSLVTSGPLFRTPLAVRTGNRVRRSGCLALDVALADARDPTHAASR